MRPLVCAAACEHAAALGVCVDRRARGPAAAADAATLACRCVEPPDRGPCVHWLILGHVQGCLCLCVLAAVEAPRPAAVQTQNTPGKEGDTTLSLCTEVLRD